MTSTVYTRTLSRALDTVGGIEELAARLGVETQHVKGWLDGPGTPPVEVFSMALDIVARGTSRLRSTNDPT